MMVLSEKNGSDTSTRDRGDRQLDATDAKTTYWRRLFRRWFIEYNPLYLCSAMLVLGGAILISHAVAREHIAFGHLAVAAIAELYAWALIGGAALLVRIGLRRPAVMLALLVAAFQCDLMLHVETSIHLGAAGTVSSVCWLGSFVAKLYALARALRLRVSPAAIAMATFGAVGLVTIPRFFFALDEQGLAALVAAWVFALFAARLWSAPVVSCEDALDAWGETVLRRAVRGTWMMWAALALGHVVFWAVEYEVSIVGLAPAAALLATRWIRRELTAWVAIGATLVLAGIATPALFYLTCAMAGCVLGLRASRGPSYRAQTVESRGPTSPYRAAASAPAPATHAGSRPEVTFALADRPAMVRLFSGAACCAYLSAWTFGWSGGAWPEHVVALDLALTAVAALLVWRARARLVIAPLVAMCFHLLAAKQIITAPSSTLQWGVLSVGIGFALLVVVVVTSWQLRRVGEDDEAMPVAPATARRGNTNAPGLPLVHPRSVE
jgi:hypothetical protein